ncbi:PAS domain-containing protein [Pacificispira sp.]|uniref:PAS domain-containing protein n=1 Tax=Pacificispira sp. TaxID=2888761 RepID=UPI003BA96B08
MGRTIQPGFEFGTAFLSDCGDDIREIYHYWNDRRGSRRSPSRSDIDPLDFHRLLPGVTLLTVVSTDPLDLVYKVVGTREVTFRGRDPTGLTVSSAFHGPSPENALRSYAAVIERHEPLFRRDTLRSLTGNMVREERIFLPLSAEDETVDQILLYASDHKEIPESLGL